MKYLNAIIIAFILLFSSSCAEEEFEDLEYNLLADTGETLLILESYDREITPPPYRINMHFTIKNRFNELSDIQKSKITRLHILSGDIKVGEAAPGATQISALNNEINFIDKCFRFVYFSGSGEYTRPSSEYCYQI